MVLIENMDKPENCMSCPFTDVNMDCILNKKESSGMISLYEQYQHCPLKGVLVF